MADKKNVKKEIENIKIIDNNKNTSSKKNIVIDKKSIKIKEDKKVKVDKSLISKPKVKPKKKIKTVDDKSITHVSNSENKKKVKIIPQSKKTNPKKVSSEKKDIVPSIKNEANRKNNNKKVVIEKVNDTANDTANVNVKKDLKKDDSKIEEVKKNKVNTKAKIKPNINKSKPTAKHIVKMNSEIKKKDIVKENKLPQEEKVKVNDMKDDLDVEPKRSDCKLFFFLSNYSELFSIYNEKFDIQFNNIKELIGNEIKSLGGEIISSDHSSITIRPVSKAVIDNEIKTNINYDFTFDNILGITYKIYEAIEYYFKLTVKDESPLKFHCGILFDDLELEKNPFRKSFLGIKKVDSSSSKRGKKKNINYSNNYLPFTLLTEKTALSIIENYNIFKSDFRSNIWYTDGIKVTESERLNKIYLNRDEEDLLESFINDRDFENTLNANGDASNNSSNGNKKKIFLFSGELGSGKTKIIDEVIRNSKNAASYDNQVLILKVSEKKHTEKEYYLIVKIIESLIDVFKEELNIDVTEIIEMINSENIEEINKQNLINLVRRYFDDLYLDKNGIPFHSLTTRLKIAFIDFLKLFMGHIDKHLTIVIDNYQYSNEYCENILLSIFGKKYINVFQKINMVFVGRDKDMMFNIKNYEKLKFQIYKKYLLNLDKELISNFLKLTFPYKKITKGLVEFVFKITGGNFYTLKEYIQDLINKEVIFSTNRSLKIKKIDNSEIPENLLEIYESKIDSLDQDTKNVLMIISIIGDSFYLVDLENLLHLLNYSGDEIIAIETLLQKGFINQLENFYYFQESELRNNIYKKIPKENKLLIHNLLGNIFENKSMKNFSFKVFYHYLFAENFDKLYELLNEILLETHLNLNFNALTNIISLSFKDLDNKIKALKVELEKKSIQKVEKPKEVVKTDETDKIEKVLDEKGEWVNKTSEDIDIKKEKEVSSKPNIIDEETKKLNKYKNLWILLVEYRLHTQKNMDRIDLENYKLLENAIIYAKEIENYDSMYKLRYKLSEYYLTEKKFNKFNEIVSNTLSELGENENFKIHIADFLILKTYYQLKKNVKDKWEKNLSKAKDIYLSLNINIDDIEIYDKTLGLLYYKTSDFQNSLKYFNSLIKKVENRIDFVEYLRILEFVSELSLNLRDYDKIELLYKKIINLCDDFGHFTKKIEYTVKLGISYGYQNRLLQAINTINPVVNDLGKYDNTKNSLILIDVYNKLGIMHQYHGENKPAEDYFNLAIDLSDSISNYEKRSFSFIRKAMFELFNFEYDNAILSLVEARNTSKKSDLTSLNSVLQKVAELGSNSTITEDLDIVVSTIDSIEKQLVRIYDRDIVFEIYLSLLRILFNKNHFLKIKTILEPKMDKMVSKIHDFNLVAEFKKISREVITGTNRKKRKIKVEKKVHPFVKKRLNRMKRR